MRPGQRLIWRQAYSPSILVETLPRPSIDTGIENGRKLGTVTLGRATKPRRKTVKVHTGNPLNDKVVNGLQAQYPTSYKDILVQAETVHLERNYRTGRGFNSPETYELLEDGSIDEALELMGLGSWAIGRPTL